MGGKAFANRALHTPRMPPTLYYVLRAKYQTILSAAYTHVSTPLEAPAKSSYGDIDILVAGPKALEQNINSNYIPQLLPEVKDIIHQSPTTSFAVPYPGLADAYIQIDLYICPSLEAFIWSNFHHAHGDFWNILGSTLRGFGLTANDKGLHLRIAEIEELDKKASLIHLTSDPDTVLDFLGLERVKYWAVFGSVEALFEYAASTRFMRRDAYVRDKLKANDRKRMRLREVYRLFVEEWLPGWEGLEEESGLSREGVFEEALRTFGKRKEYEVKIGRWRMERMRLEAKWQANAARRERALADATHADAWVSRAVM